MNKRIGRFGEKLGFGTGTFLAIGAVDALAHLGPTGLVIGGIAAYVASQHGPELLEQAKGMLPEQQEVPAIAPVSLHSTKVLATKRSLSDRFFGRFPQENDEEECYVSEETMPAPRRSPSLTRASLDIADGVSINKNDIAGKAIFICGIRRHGKTTLGARLAEQLGKQYIPLFIPCLEGDYLSLADVLPRAIVAGHPNAEGQYQNYRFEALGNVKIAFQLGYDLLECGYQVILDLASYATLDQAIAIQVNVIRGMFHWANTHPDTRVPAHVWLDEAQRYLPQALSDSVILDKTLLGELLRCYMDIIAIGGKRGIAPVILTQRFAQVNKKIMAQSEVLFLMRQTNDNDLDRCAEYVNEEVATKEQISMFKPGQCVYIASDGSQQVIQCKDRQSSGKRSSTPQADGAYRYASMSMKRTPVATETHRAFRGDEVKEEVKPLPHPEIAGLVEPEPQQHRMGRVDLQKNKVLLLALQYYQSGADGPRPLGRAMGISPATAKGYIDQLRAMGEIE